MSTFRQNLSAFGFTQSLLILLLTTARRFFEFEVCLVQINSGMPYEYDAVPDYTCRRVDGETFHACLSEGLKGEDLRWAFERDDDCIANFHGDTIVGYSFVSSRPTHVLPGVEFTFPDWYRYGYADATDPDHRGKRLARERWRTARQLRNASGEDPRSIHYINVLNVSSRKADLSVPNGLPSITLGYTAWWNWRGKTHCWQSRGARQQRVGFRRIV